MQNGFKRGQDSTVREIQNCGNCQFIIFFLKFSQQDIFPPKKFFSAFKRHLRTSVAFSYLNYGSPIPDGVLGISQKPIRSFRDRVIDQKRPRMIRTQLDRCPNYELYRRAAKLNPFAVKRNNSAIIESSILGLENVSFGIRNIIMRRYRFNFFSSSLF